MRVRANRFASMAGSGSRRWAAFCLIGIAAWVGVTVLVAVLNDDPSDGRPVVLAFAGGAAVFFGIVFGVGLWQTRPRADPELDALLGELALEPDAAAGRTAAIGAMRVVARAYLVLGALVTALGLAAIVQEGLGVGSPKATLFVLVGIVVVWALAVPAVLRLANSASAAVLEPLGLARSGAALVGERHGRPVRIELTGKGSVTRLDAPAKAPELAGDEILAYAGRGDAATWEGVRVEPGADRITIRRAGLRGPAWLWDVWLAERLIEGA
jgi:hypothetical protein